MSAQADHIIRQRRKTLRDLYVPIYGCRESDGLMALLTDKEVVSEIKRIVQNMKYEHPTELEPTTTERM